MFSFLTLLFTISGIITSAQNSHAQEESEPLIEKIVSEQEIQVNPTSQTLDSLPNEDDPEPIEEHFRTVDTANLIVDIYKYSYWWEYYYRYEYGYPTLWIKLKTSYWGWCNSEEDENWTHFPYFCKIIGNLFIASWNRIEYRFSSDKFVEVFKKNKHESLFTRFKQEMNQKYGASDRHTEDEDCTEWAFNHSYYYCTDGIIAFVESHNKEKYIRTPYTPWAVLYTIDDIEFLE